MFEAKRNPQPLWRASLRPCVSVAALAVLTAFACQYGRLARRRSPSSATPLIETQTTAAPKPGWRSRCWITIGRRCLVTIGGATARRHA